MNSNLIVLTNHERSKHKGSNLQHEHRRPSLVPSVFSLEI